MYDLTTTRAALTTIATLWPHLADAVAQRQNTEWPPAMGITKLREPDEFGDGRPGDVRTLPLNVDVFDAMADITGALVALADHVAADTQRPAMSHAPRDRQWTPGDRQQRDHLADTDAADPRRWRYTGTRTAPHAARWLHDRLVSRPGGPFRPLSLQHVHRIETTATAAAQRIEQLLRIARRTTSTGRQHDGCGGNILVSGGDGTDPEAHCDRCGRTWRPAIAA
ncbi:hypothetical protein [Streptomyces sp. SBT349]|uniref:hypothetical protein n=1 Tax=Streptomyces sp. SBT349 TaxID=1580539 RepID=UPI00066E7065|nr:hypothetical protein [Streptomyces sp. SBT349]